MGLIDRSVTPPPGAVTMDDLCDSWFSPNEPISRIKLALQAEVV